MTKFSKGDRVTFEDGGEARTGTVSNVYDWYVGVDADDGMKWAMSEDSLEHVEDGCYCSESLYCREHFIGVGDWVKVTGHAGLNPGRYDPETGTTGQVENIRHVSAVPEPITVLEVRLRNWERGRVVWYLPENVRLYAYREADGTWVYASKFNPDPDFTSHIEDDGKTIDVSEDVEKFRKQQEEAAERYLARYGRAGKCQCDGLIKLSLAANELADEIRENGRVMADRLRGVQHNVVLERSRNRLDPIPQLFRVDGDGWLDQARVHLPSKIWRAMGRPDTLEVTLKVPRDATERAEA